MFWRKRYMFGVGRLRDTSCMSRDTFCILQDAFRMSPNTGCLPQDTFEVTHVFARRMKTKNTPTLKS